MSVPATVEFVFVELAAASEDGAKRDVTEALRDLRITGWNAGEALPDPDRPAFFGVEVEAPPGTPPNVGWDVAHALAAHLMGDTTAEAVLVPGDPSDVESALPNLSFEEGISTAELAPPGNWHLLDINAE